MLRFTYSIRTSPLVPAALLVAFFCACDSGSPTQTGGTGGTPSNQGRFIDAPCSGLEYVSGENSGVTDGNGSYTYKAGDNVGFSIGGITLGGAPSASRMNPLHLANATNVTDPTATNIARFLQTIDNDGNPANGIEVTAAVRAAAAGQSINFLQDVDVFETDTDVLSVVSDLTSATQAGNRSLVSAAAAQSQLASGIRAGYQGGKSGTYCRNGETGQLPGGTWTMDVGANGQVSMTFTGTPSFNATGTMDLTGVVNIAILGGPTIYGSFSPTFSGVFYIGTQSGTFREGTKSCSAH